jgi:hypothetical protein
VQTYGAGAASLLKICQINGAASTETDVGFFLSYGDMRFMKFLSTNEIVLLIRNFVKSLKGMKAQLKLIFSETILLCFGDNKLQSK